MARGLGPDQLVVGLIDERIARPDAERGLSWMAFRAPWPGRLFLSKRAKS